MKDNWSVLAGAGCAERGEKWGREAREENSRLWSLQRQVLLSSGHHHFKEEEMKT